MFCNVNGIYHFIQKHVMSKPGGTDCVEHCLFGTPYLLLPPGVLTRLCWPLPGSS